MKRRADFTGRRFLDIARGRNYTVYKTRKDGETMKPEMCGSCGTREFVEKKDAYICAYCDTVYPKIQTEAVPPYTEPPVVRAKTEIWNGRQKNKWVAFGLCLFLGPFGGHKFYEGRIGMGIVYFLTCGLFGIGWIADCFRLLCRKNPYYV